MRKQFIDIICNHKPDGTVCPLYILWPDGRSFKILRTLHTAAASDREYDGIRYTVLIGSNERHIYRTGSRWYVEPVLAEVGGN